MSYWKGLSGFGLALFFALMTISQPLYASHWKRISFANLDELVTYFERIHYTVDHWDKGDHSVPRVYLSHIPPRWQESTVSTITVVEKKRYFLFILAPLVLRANEIILQQRMFIQKAQKAGAWTAEQKAELQDIAVQYAVTMPVTPQDEVNFTLLLRRVDIVPVSLALSQGAIESSWGTSRFAREGNALFGQWAWGDNVMAPKQIRKELGNYGVQKFNTPFESITAYMQNLNTHTAYRDFRTLRETHRRKNQPLSGMALAKGLLSYSELGQVYVDDVRQLIRINRLEETDKAVLRKDEPVVLEPIGKGSR